MILGVDCHPALRLNTLKSPPVRATCGSVQPNPRYADREVGWCHGFGYAERRHQPLALAASQRSADQGGQPATPVGSALEEPRHARLLRTWRLLDEGLSPRPRGGRVSHPLRPRSRFPDIERTMHGREVHPTVFIPGPVADEQDALRVGAVTGQGWPTGGPLSMPFRSGPPQAHCTARPRPATVDIAGPVAGASEPAESGVATSCGPRR